LFLDLRLFDWLWHWFYLKYRSANADFGLATSSFTRELKFRGWNQFQVNKHDFPNKKPTLFNRCFLALEIEAPVLINSCRLENCLWNINSKNCTKTRTMTRLLLNALPLRLLYRMFARFCGYERKHCTYKQKCINISYQNNLINSNLIKPFRWLTQRITKFHVE
jgi:hypothetical protein